jgi:hypothetical protein
VAAASPSLSEVELQLSRKREKFQLRSGDSEAGCLSRSPSVDLFAASKFGLGGAEDEGTYGDANGCLPVGHGAPGLGQSIRRACHLGVLW